MCANPMIQEIVLFTFCQMKLTSGDDVGEFGKRIKMTNGYDFAFFNCLSEGLNFWVFKVKDIQNNIGIQNADRHA